MENSDLTVPIIKQEGARIIFALVTGLLLSAQAATGGTITTCSRYQSVTVGSYIFQTDYWNEGQCPGTQCVSIDDQTGAYTVTKGDFQCPNGAIVAAYPSILYGRAWGLQSPNCGLPARVDALKCVNSDWSFQPTNTGAWDAAYDIWLCPDNSCGPSGFPGGAEVMIWLDYRNTNGWQYDKGPATIDGMDWEVWYWDTSVGGDRRTYVAYLAKNRTDSIKNLDIKKFLEDCRARGYIKSSWYLYAVEAGNELRFGGIPFTSKSFSVSVNKDCGAKPVFTPLPLTPTPTPDLTPEVIPPPP